METKVKKLTQVDNFQKVILITGASSGIGKELARSSLKRDWNVILFARRKEELEKFQQDFDPKLEKTLIVTGDVNSDIDLHRAVDLGIQKFKRLDIVIANAGFGVVGKVEDLAIEDYKRQMETNFYGVVRTVKAVLPELKKTHGNLALVGSVQGYVTLPGGSPYAVSKFAVRALAESLYYELKKDDVSVTHIAPGFVVSNIRRVDNQGQFHEGSKDRIPKWIQVPTEIAAEEILRAVSRRKKERVVTGHGKVIVFIKRHWPGLLDFLLDRFQIAARDQPRMTK